MSKKLVIIRHAEAEDNFGQKDFQRQLTEIGKKNVKSLAAYLLKEKINPDFILASSSERTKETALILNQTFQLDSENISFRKSLYNATAEDLETAIVYSDVPNDAETLFLIAHNPGISEFANECAFNNQLSSLSPGDVVVVDASIDIWMDFDPSKTKFLFYKSPQNS